MKYICFLLTVVILNGSDSNIDEPYRIWKNNNNKEIKAKLISLDKNSAVFNLKLENGRKISANSRFFCEEDLIYANRVRALSQSHLESNYDIRCSKLDPFNYPNKRRDVKKEVRHFCPEGKWDPRKKLVVHRKGTKFENSCLCHSAPLLMRKTSEDNYNCIFESRLKKWLDIFPHESKDYIGIYIIRGNSGTNYMSSYAHRVDKNDLQKSIFIKLREGETIKDISFIENFPNIKFLQINDCHVEDLSPLNKLTNLNRLNLDNNKVTSFEKLSNNKNLYAISFNRNNIRYINKIHLFSKTKLTYIDFSHNPIETDPLDLDRIEKRFWDENLWGKRDLRCRNESAERWLSGINVIVKCTGFHSLIHERVGGSLAIKSNRTPLEKINSYKLKPYDLNHFTFRHTN